MEGQNEARLSKPPSEIYKYKTVQPDNETIPRSNGGGTEGLTNGNHYSKMTYVYSNSLMPTLQSREYLQMHSDHGTDQEKDRRHQLL